MSKLPESSAVDGAKPLDKSPDVETLQLGVYSIHRFKPRRDPIELYKKWKEHFVALSQLMWDVYTLAPMLVLVLVFIEMVKRSEDVILLGFEMRILRIMEIGIHEGRVDSSALIKAVAARLLCVMVAGGVSTFAARLRRRLRARVVQYFDNYLLNYKLELDLSMLADNMNDDLEPTGIWHSVQSTVEIFTRLFSVLGQLSFIYHLGRSSNYGVFFVLLCLFRPVLSLVMFPANLNEPRVVEATNPHYLRMQALKALAEKKFRSDILGGNIVGYIKDQFQKARTALGDVSSEHPELLLWSMVEESPFSVFAEATNDLPTIFCAALVILNPTATNLSTVFSLRQSVDSLRITFMTIFWEVESLSRQADIISRLYHLKDKLAQTQVKDGDLVYNARSEEEKSDFSRGMGIDVRDVVFSYPGGDTNASALDHASFAISPGQLVVIVGANGSGKSTLIKLLGRLFNPTSGTILVDGEDITQYQLASLRQAIAMLTQDHHLYPLSIKENIGLGFIEKMDDETLIWDAARKGGAEGVIKGLSNGIETVLDPKGYQFAHRVMPDDKTGLGDKLRGLNKTGDVSGGERQRLVAARTFMRFNSDSVKLIAVDEPSSALDPEAELELFENIRSMRKGKTVIFVTHRFGHLTKHADVILCMDKGRVIESGTHSELMKMEGQYCKMYSVQAQAFEEN